jgi:hypothetical protein
MEIFFPLNTELKLKIENNINTAKNKKSNLYLIFLNLKITKIAITIIAIIKIVVISAMNKEIDVNIKTFLIN